jgi:hypothetical protein
MVGRPCDFPDVPRARIRSCRVAPLGSAAGNREEDRCALSPDVHRDFCEVTIAEGGEVRLGARVKTSPEELELFAGSLAADDQVVLEATGNALAIAHIAARKSGCTRQPEGGQRHGANCEDRQLDARGLVQLLAVCSAAGPSSSSGARVRRIRPCDPDPQSAGAAPVTDLFGVQGRA